VTEEAVAAAGTERKELALVTVMAGTVNVKLSAASGLRVRVPPLRRTDERRGLRRGRTVSAAPALIVTASATVPERVARS
jgi:hypothetical protein